MEKRNGVAGGFRAWMIFLFLGCVVLMVSCASTGSEVKDEARWQANQVCKGMKAYAHGYTQYHQALLKAEMGEPEKAQRHLQRAQNDFLKAIEHFQKA